MNSSFFKWAALMGGLSVVLGAFGAHALKSVLTAEALMTYETAVKYQMYHSLALFGVGLLRQTHSSNWLKYSGHAFIIGVFLFSGSLYLLTLLKATATVGLGGLGLITPVGGLFFIAGWLMLFRGVSKSSQK